MGKLKAGTLICSILFCVFIISCGSKNAKPNSTQNKTMDKDKLIVGMELQFPPFETIDKNGKPYGLSVDLALALGDYLNKEIKIEEMSYSGLINALMSKKIDMIISSMTISSNRLEQIDFSEPYASSHLSLLINEKSLVQGPDDLNNKGIKIAVKRGTTGQIFAEKQYPNASISVFEKDAECIMEVVQGRVDVFVYDVYTIYKNHMLNPNTTRVYLEAINKGSIEKWGVAIRKNEESLKKGINDFIKEAKSNGKIDEIVDVHLSDMKRIFEENNLNFYF